mgnify:CR=1 FL=1
MKTLRLLLLLLVLSTTALSQTSFMVMSVKGKVTFKDAGKGKWRAVSVGDVLDGKDVVRASFASYVKLMMNQSRLVSIDANTTRKLSEFEAVKGRRGGEGASGSILEYAAKQMKRSQEDNSDPVFGAVRGDMDVFTAVFPKYAVMSPAPLFRWVDAEKAESYELILLDDMFNTVMTLEIYCDSFLYLPDSLPQLNPDRQYHWRITRLTDYVQSDIQTFRILPQDTVQAINAELQSLDKELKEMGADDVTLHLIRGIYYEKRGLYTDAFLEYEQTIALAPDVEEYRDMMRNLLFNMKLYAEEDLLLE